MQKRISDREPICAVGGVQGHQNPHHVATVESFDPETRKIRFRCTINPKKGLVATLPEGIIIPVGSYCLLQEKSKILMKVKDWNDAKKWVTGQYYSPVIGDSIAVMNHQHVKFERTPVAA